MTEFPPGLPTSPDDLSPTIGFSDLELRYLLRYLDPEVRARVARYFRFGARDAAVEEQQDTAAASALLARGFLVIVESPDPERPGQAVVPTGEGALVLGILAQTVTWTMLQVTDGGTNADLAVLGESPVGKFFAQPRALDTWWFVLLDPRASGEEITSGTLVGLAEQWPEAAVFARLQSGDLDLSLTVHRKQAEWSWAFGTTGSPDPTEKVENSDRAAFDGALERFFRDIPVVAPVA
jgi:hypothetical protein